MSVLEETECTCDLRHSGYTCPYREEIYDDYQSLCTCCEYCEEQCAWDI